MYLYDLLKIGLWAKTLKKIGCYQLSRRAFFVQGKITPCLHIAHQNTRVMGANLVIICHKTRVNTLKS